MCGTHCFRFFFCVVFLFGLTDAAWFVFACSILVVTSFEKCVATVRFAHIGHQHKLKRLRYGVCAVHAEHAVHLTLLWCSRQPRSTLARRAWQKLAGMTDASAMVSAMRVEQALGEALSQVAAMQSEVAKLQGEVRAAKRREVALKRQLLQPFVFGGGDAPASATTTSADSSQ